MKQLSMKRDRLLEPAVQALSRRAQKLLTANSKREEAKSIKRPDNRRLSSLGRTPQQRRRRVSRVRKDYSFHVRPFHPSGDVPPMITTALADAGHLVLDCLPV